jgi:hypothetical protein
MRLKTADGHLGKVFETNFEAGTASGGHPSQLQIRAFISLGVGR